jgi:hypothetical protein
MNIILCVCVCVSIELQISPVAKFRNFWFQLRSGFFGTIISFVTYAHVFPELRYTVLQSCPKSILNFNPYLYIFFVRVTWAMDFIRYVKIHNSD